MGNKLGAIQATSNTYSNSLIILEGSKIPKGGEFPLVPLKETLYVHMYGVLVHMYVHGDSVSCTRNT